jgi:imidazolonepropionase-like amidohydrolase
MKIMSRRFDGWRLPILALVLATGCGDRGSPTAVAFTHVTVINPGSTSPVTDQTVVVDSGRIVRVGASDQVRPGARATVVDGTGKYLIPGLWDMHVHLGSAGECALPLFLANGVTGVRDLGGPVEVSRAWRDSIDAGRQVGPRIKLAGPIIEDAAWLTGVTEFLIKSGDTTTARELNRRAGIATIEDSRRIVDSIAGLNVDVLKVRNSASADVFTAIVAAAKAKGLRVAAHAPGMDLRRAAEAGVGSLEHTETVTLALQKTGLTARDLGPVMAQHSTMLTPTFIAQHYWRVLPDSTTLRMIADSSDPRSRLLSPSLRASWRLQMDMKKGESPMDWAKLNAEQLADFSALRDAGVLMLAGTDLGAVLIYPGYGLHEELELMVKTGGLAPMQVLESATRNPARFFGQDSTLGVITPGAEADLVLLDANPLDDIAHTRRIHAVMARGRLFERAALDGFVARAERGVNGGSCRIPVSGSP